MLFVRSALQTFSLSAPYLDLGSSAFSNSVSGSEKRKLREKYKLRKLFNCIFNRPSCQLLQVLTVKAIHKIPDKGRKRELLHYLNVIPANAAFYNEFAYYFKIFINFI